MKRLHRIGRFSTGVFAAAMVWLVPSILLAQSDRPAPPDRTVSADAEAQANAKVSVGSDGQTAPSENFSETETSTSKDAASEESEDSELEALKARVRELERRAETDEGEFAEVKMRLDMQEDAEITRMTERTNELRVYGFMDVQFRKFFVADDSLVDGLAPTASSFALGHWNVFLEKPLGDHFRVLGEVRFMFQPLGEEANGWMGSGDFERVDTEATDWLDAYYFNWGGISIQRAYIEYKLNDYFGIRAGHFLTPYGIWNVDHASTVVISAHRPYLNTTRYLPEAQTGLYLFGRAFLAPPVSVDYGLTLSNGRGPTVEVYDLDENKAVGLNLKLRYDGAVHVEAGTYLYMGDCTDTTRRLEVDGTSPDFIEDVTLKYKEKVFSVHLKLDWKGLLLQGEYVRGLVEYKDGKRPPATFGVGNVAYAPDHIQQGAYALIGYMLPFDKVQIRPYLFYEYMDPPDWSGYPYGHTYGGGINWRIIPPVVWKIEFYRVNNNEREDLPSSDLNVLVTQLAVSY